MNFLNDNTSLVSISKKTMITNQGVFKFSDLIQVDKKMHITRIGIIELIRKDPQVTNIVFIEDLNHFAFRAECMNDIIRFKEGIDRVGIKAYFVDRPSQDDFPDVECDLYIDSNITFLFIVLGLIVDAHVMIETLNTSVNYTGVRDSHNKQRVLARSFDDMIDKEIEKRNIKLDNSELMHNVWYQLYANNTHVKNEYPPVCLSNNNFNTNKSIRVVVKFNGLGNSSAMNFARFDFDNKKWLIEGLSNDNPRVQVEAWIHLLH